MIKLDNSFSLSQAAKRLPSGRNGRPVSSSTMIRWIVSGVRGPDDEVVRLEAVRLGSRWVTDEAALQRFAERSTPSPPFARGSGPSPARRSGVERELDERGL